MNNARINEFVNKLTDFCKNHPTHSHFWKDLEDKFVIDKGRRYVRIVKDNAGRRTVYCFVDLTNGNILKAATWKAPAPRGIRANINDADFGLRACAFHGLKYLKR